MGTDRHVDLRGLRGQCQPRADDLLPQVVGVEGLRERARGVVGRRDLVGRHSAEEVVHPARALARTLIIADLLRAKTLGSLGVVAEQHLVLGDGNEEIGKPDECEE